MATRRSRMSLRLLVLMAFLLTAGCEPSPPAAIGIQSVHATPEFRVPESPNEVAMFVETGSTSEHCLATLQESQTFQPVRELFCAHRSATFDGGATHVEGIWLHVFFATDPGERLDLWISVYQEGAKAYGTPRFCWVEHGCQSATPSVRRLPDQLGDPPLARRRQPRHGEGHRPHLLVVEPRVGLETKG